MIISNIKPTLALVVAFNIILITYSVLLAETINKIDKALSND